MPDHVRPDLRDPLVAPDPIDGPRPDRPTRPAYTVALVLGGGNALGAYQAGAYEALAQADLPIDWVVGASTGAISGAIICGNPPEQRLERLRAYWRPGGGDDRHGTSNPLEDMRRTMDVAMRFAMGQPQVFAPRIASALWQGAFGNETPDSLYDTAPLAATLATLVDFDRLNLAPIRFSLTAVDLESGEDLVFDSRRDAIGPDHVRASGAFLPLFPPIEIDGRLCADSGLSANLPIDVVLADPPGGPTLCIAIDLLPRRAPRPRSLGEIAERAQDLVFACQSRRAIAGWKRVYDLQAAAATDATGPDAIGSQPVTLIHLAYAAQEPEVCGKAFDFSPGSIAHRWHQGRRDMDAIIASLRSGAIAVDRPGLTVHAFDGERPMPG